jgi:two-component system, cell cycle sensor histidine kinase and response regulator CckA
VVSLFALKKGLMAEAKVLVVEDEIIVAKDIQDRLRRLGYIVPAVVSTGEEAIKKASETQPDLVLMDIVLKGEMDGIEAAREIRDCFNIPVIYLTAHADESTLSRTKTTEPYGYIIKPFEEIELRTTIEMALYKHEMEKRLKENQQWFAAILRCIGDAVIATDIEGSVTFMNPVAEALTGWKQNEALGRGLTEVFKIVDEQTRAITETPVLRASREEVAINLTAPTLLISRDGKETPIDTSAAPIRGHRGESAGVVLVFRDITERKHLEEQLRQSQKMEAVGQLAGGVAHDFNNLLTVIIGLSDLIIRKLDPTLRIYHQAEEIKRAGEQAASLTQQLLAFSRRQILQPKVLDLNGVVTYLNKMLLRLIGEDIELVSIPDERLGFVKADRGQIEQVILNLAVNARDAMPNGGRLIIETANVNLYRENVRLTVGMKPGSYVMLAVSDTGCGMDLETQSHIFEPFFTTKKMGKGTGLGLATVYGIIQQSGGYITVHSEPGRGTTFKVYLPRIEETAEPPQIVVVHSGMPRGSETIMVVEDKVGVRKLISDLLRESGYTVIEACSGAEALQICEWREEPIHLMLTDVVMPQMSGRELADHMTARYPEMRILYMSGYVDRATDLLEKGVFFLEKPFAIDAIARKVRDALDAH